MHRFILTMSAIILFVAASFARNNHTSAPHFTGKTVDGQLVHLADYKGRVVLLNFWTSANKSSREDFSFLMKLHEKARRGAFTMLVINLDADAAQLKNLLTGLQPQPGFPIVNDAERKISSLYGLKNIPATLVLDKKGLVRYRHHELLAHEQQKLATEIKMLLVE